MDVSRLHRVLRLLTILQSGATPSVAELVAELGVSKRTLYRDLNILEAAGIPYFHEADKGYRLAPSFFLPPVNLKVTEAMGLMTLAKAASAKAGEPLAKEAVSAIRKLIAQMPEPIREVCGQMMKRTSVRPGASSVVRGDGDHFAALQRAIDERRVVRMRYHSLFAGGEIDAVVRPYHLHYAVRAWYVMGYCEENRDVRTYKLGRVRSLELTAARFKPDESWTIEKHLGKAWKMIPEGKVERVELEFEPMVAHNVAEVRWHATQRHEMRPDGRCRMSFDVDGLNEIAWWLLGYGDQVRVVKPAALRDRLTATYRAALGRYDGAGKTGEAKAKARASKASGGGAGSRSPKRRGGGGRR